MLAYHPSWIDEDFNPRGIRIGFWNGGDDLEKTDEDMYYNSEWDYTCEESELEPEDKNDPDVHKVYEAGMYYIYSN